MTTPLRPNILVTGTPGTGKTSLCTLLCEEIGFRHINIGEVAKEKNLYDGYDEERDCPVLDDDKVCDELEDAMVAGGCVVDFHTCDWFPERWFSLVLVLRTDNTTLYDRLVARGYSGKKLDDNIECEIMQVVVQQAHDSYASEIVVELSSNTPEDQETAVERVAQWLTAHTSQ